MSSSLKDSLLRCLTEKSWLSEYALNAYAMRDIATWGICHGIGMYRDASDRINMQLAPIAALPSPIPKRLYAQALSLSTPFGDLADRIACDFPWLQASLKSVCEVDDFTAKIMAMCERVYADPTKAVSTDVRLYVLRSDYMIDSRPDQPQRLMQVELNTIAASFAGLGQRVSALQRFAIRRLAEELYAKTDQASESASAANVVQSVVDDISPPNAPADNMATAIAAAHTAYLRRRPIERGSGRRPAVLYMVPDNERNEIDQRHLEFALYDTHGVTCRRSTFQDLADAIESGALRILPDNPSASTPLATPGRLVWQRGLDEVLELTVVYFRSGYAPPHLPDDRCWAAREVLEWSHAVKCPSGPAHLAGCKKVQALWCDPSTMDRFVPVCSRQPLREVFAPQVDPSMAPKGEEVKDAIQHPEEWVLKPQREGGGNNLHGQDIVRTLTKGEGLSEYILMKKIRPPVLPSLVFDRTDTAELKAFVRPSLAELGIYSAKVMDGSEEVYNETLGHLLRSKDEGSNEGGVAAGFAVVDSLLLV
ncbi:unnamed protein product [Vitrella brassicaformis CCMP3155]|uniref:Glutathione synthetase n=1 Tax=Vitrella brassicaformis (strain CCMP3155) TaxID=1169540 RepID=A0A0G4GR48_VITBC|nr:unnamed protein product [Vitrella brassicaformis CCMP3155]|eukprot:CEM33001.1 unnamed protein product [Vitrella brassicaformis CCMP3155]